MTRYTVTWNEYAVEDLARTWIESTDRQKLTHAVASIDASLMHDPLIKGIDFYGDRLLVIPPLAVVFAVRADDRIVEVLLVWPAPVA